MHGINETGKPEPVRPKSAATSSASGSPASDKFKALLEMQANSATFVLQPCDGLAHAIERSAETGETADTIALCTRYTQAMGKFGFENGQIDTLVLGCTHYPFASEHLRALLGPEVQLLDNGEAIARQTRRLVQTAPVPSDQTEGRVQLMTTGQPLALQAAARRWLGLPTGVGVLTF